MGTSWWRTCAEFVRDHRSDLVGREVVDQVVVEDDPLRVAEPAHVGVDAGRAPAGVDPVDLSHVDSGAVGQIDDVRAKRALGERVEAVEQGIDEDRRQIERDHGEGHHDSRAGKPPAPWEPADQGDRDRPAEPGEHRSDSGGLGHVGKPRPQRLGGQAHVDRPLMSPEPERQARDRQGQRHARRHRGAAEDRACARPRHQGARARRGPQRQHGQGSGADRQSPDPDQALHTAKIGRSLQLSRAEVGCGIDGRRLDQPASGAKDERGSRGGGDRRSHCESRPRAMPPHAPDSNDISEEPRSPVQATRIAARPSPPPDERPMRVALISDIHGNLPALQAVLDDIATTDVDEVWCLGDLVGYGAQPNECVELAAERCDLCLAGNHDLGVLDKIDIADFSPPAAAAALWTRQGGERRNDRLPRKSRAGAVGPGDRPVPRESSRPGVGVRALHLPGERVHGRDARARGRDRALARGAALHPHGPDPPWAPACPRGPSWTSPTGVGC